MRWNNSESQKPKVQRKGPRLPTIQRYRDTIEMSFKNVLTAGVLSFLVVASLYAQTKPKQNPPVNRDAAISADFEKRVADYMKLRQKAQTGLDGTKTEDPAKIQDFQHQLAARIRALRADAKQGDLFTPETVGLFHRLVASALNSPDGGKIRASFDHAEPIKGLHLDVNQSYPDGIPLQSMPPSLLLNLPKLPKELEYRFVGRELILRDTQADLIVDAIPDVSTLKQP